MKWLRGTRVLVLLIAALLAASVGSTVLRPTATTVGVGLTITADQSALGLTVGAQAVVAVVVSQPGSLLGPIALSVTGAPIGVSLSYPHTVLGGVPAVIVAYATSTSPLGTYHLSITATSGTTTTTITIVLVISLPTGFTMVMNPPSQTVIDGQSTSYTITINRGLLAGPIGLKLSGVPQFATASVNPGLSILGNTATVNVSTATNVVPGIYLLTVKGTALFGSGTASAYLIVQPQVYPNFPLKGQPDRVLAPGSPPGAINVAITNPFNSPMTVTNIGVTVTGTNKPGCGANNYQALAYTGTPSLTIPANSTRTLLQLGQTRDKWPAIQMLNLPVNQNVCKGAIYNLLFSAVGNGS